jgi:hypothetical protein
LKKNLRHQLEEIKARTVVERADIWTVTDCMDELLFGEEMMWLQRSRILGSRKGIETRDFFIAGQGGELGRTRSEG